MTGRELKAMLLEKRVVLNLLAKHLGISQQALSQRFEAKEVKSSFLQQIEGYLTAIDDDMQALKDGILEESIPMPYTNTSTKKDDVNHNNVNPKTNQYSMNLPLYEMSRTHTDSINQLTNAMNKMAESNLLLAQAVATMVGTEKQTSPKRKVG